MHRLMTFLLLSILLTSCGSGKSVSSRKSNYDNAYKSPENSQIANIIDYALSFEGVPYKWGGTDRKGMDCSGLVYTAFKKEQIQLPRVSRNMAEAGRTVRNEDLALGDLLFFKTERSREVNHVGIVIDLKPQQVLFLHTTVSLGVIISSLDERYWAESYSGARRVH